MLLKFPLTLRFSRWKRTGSVICLCDAFLGLEFCRRVRQYMRVWGDLRLRQTSNTSKVESIKNIWDKALT